MTGTRVAGDAMSPIRQNVIWATDFQFDTTAHGVVDAMDRLILTHAAPHYVRFDNGPGFVAHTVSDWCRFNGAVSVNRSAVGRPCIQVRGAGRRF